MNKEMTPIKRDCSYCIRALIIRDYRKADFLFCLLQSLSWALIVFLFWVLERLFISKCFAVSVNLDLLKLLAMFYAKWHLNIPTLQFKLLSFFAFVV